MKAAAYNACTRMTHGGITYDFRRKAREHIGKTLLLTPRGFPAEAFQNPGQLWRAAEAAERRGDAQTARQILITIPREVPADSRVDFVKYLCRPMQEAGMTLQVDLHDPGARDGGEQPHAHVLATMRELDGAAFAKTKSVGREWNRMFTENKGREMRRQMADRMNGWFEMSGLSCRVDHRSGAAIDGEDSIPPEPKLARVAIEIEKRRPGSSGQIRRLDQHRQRRRQVQLIDSEIASAERESANIKRRISQRQEARRRGNMGSGPWVRETGELSPAQLTSARISYQNWRLAQRGRGKRDDQIFPFEQYVDYVREKKANEPDRPHTRRIQPGDKKDAAFARTTYRDREPGFTRRHRFLANLLAEHYATDELDPAVAAGIKRIQLDRAAKTATVYLRDGSSFTDHGDRIEFHGRISQPSATEIAAAAARHGWVQVQLTGTDSFRDETAIALALREPPIAHDHTLSPAAAARLAGLLAERAQANSISGTQETNDVANSIRGVSGPADAGAAATGGPDGPAARAGSDAILDALTGSDTRVPARPAGLPRIAAVADTESGDGSEGVADAEDNDILPRLLTFYEPRVKAAEALLAARPQSVAGTSKYAKRAQDAQAEFDSRDTVQRARITVATAEALADPTRQADLIDAVRRTGQPTAAEDEFKRQQQELARQQTNEPPRDQPEGPRL